MKLVRRVYYMQLLGSYFFCLVLLILCSYVADWMKYAKLSTQLSLLTQQELKWVAVVHFVSAIVSSFQPVKRVIVNIM